MLSRTIYAAAFLGAASTVPVSVPLLIFAVVLLVMVSLALVLTALKNKDRVQARLRLGRWYSFSLDVGNGVLRASQDPQSKLASKAGHPASKP